MKYKILIFFSTVIVLTFVFFVNVKADCVRSSLTCEENNDFIVQSNTKFYLFGEAIYRMKRQYTGTDVFCVRKGASAPAFGTGKDFNMYTCSTSESFEDNLRAGIGYAINWYNSSGKSNDDYGITQIAIHKFLSEKVEDSAAPNITEPTEEFNNLYNAMLAEYNSYNFTTLNLNTKSLIFNLNEGNYESNTLTVSHTNLESYNYNLKINDVIKNDYLYKDGDKFTIKIPVTDITEKVDVKLEVSSSRNYYLANMKDCSENKQPIAESYIEQKTIIYETTATGTLKPNYCISNFEADNKESRVILYETLKSMGINYNNLLNFDVTDSFEACSNVSCDYKDNSSCLYASLGMDSNFSENNLSCYNDEITVSGKKLYCLTTFGFQNYIPGNVINFYGTNGQLISELSINPIASGKLKMNCFYFGNSIEDNIYLKYSDYVENIKFDQIELLYDNSLANESQLLIKSGNQYYKEIQIDYSFPVVYVKNGSGNRNESNCNTCKSIGSGYLTKFMYNKSKIVLPFEMNFKKHFENVNINSDGVGTCTYTPYHEIIVDDNLELEYRVINTSNPFPGKNGTFRKVGSNWCEKNIDDSFDCSGDGNENAQIKKYIFDRNDSHNKTGVGPKYKIELTPSQIKAIQEYNKLTKYDDYTLYCETNGQNCHSKFLEGLKNGKLILYDEKTNNSLNSWTIKNKLIIKEDAF